MIKQLLLTLFILLAIPRITSSNLIKEDTLKTVLKINNNTIENQWNILVKSSDSKSEKKAINLLTKTVSNLNGYWKVIAKTKNGAEINLIHYKGDLDNILNFDIIFYWQDKKFHGKNWVPLKKESVYEFYKDV